MTFVLYVYACVWHLCALRRGEPTADEATPEVVERSMEYWYNLRGPENQDVIDAERDCVRSEHLVGLGLQGHSISLLTKLGEDAGAEPVAAQGAARDRAPSGGLLTSISGSTASQPWIRRFTDCQAHFTQWWPLLTGLAALIGDARPPVRDAARKCLVCVYVRFRCCRGFVTCPGTVHIKCQVRSRALEALFGLLREFGPGFSSSFWGLVYRGVLLPMFDDVRHAQRPESPIIAGAIIPACRTALRISSCRCVSFHNTSMSCNFRKWQHVWHPLSEQASMRLAMCLSRTRLGRCSSLPLSLTGSSSLPCAHLGVDDISLDWC